MDFESLVRDVLKDERVKKIPILYVIEVLICVDEILKGEDYV